LRLATDSYNKYNIFQLEGITINEFVNGIWKRPESKESLYLERKPTSENIHALAEFKGISDDMALKYWNHTCSKCGKNVIPIANSMFFKIYGRMENEEDNRGRLCQKCLCEALNITSKEYFEKALQYKNEGCELF
jgi:phosphoadenosine phosphosulfate reductase